MKAPLTFIPARHEPRARAAMVLALTQAHRASPHRHTPMTSSCRHSGAKLRSCMIRHSLTLAAHPNNMAAKWPLPILLLGQYGTCTCQPKTFFALPSQPSHCLAHTHGPTRDTMPPRPRHDRDLAQARTSTSLAWPSSASFGRRSQNAMDAMPLEPAVSLRSFSRARKPSTPSEPISRFIEHVACALPSRH
jgi:hypothetical protein